jgi:ABC-type transport system substrate-binding protein
MKNFPWFRIFTCYRFLAYLLPAVLLASWLCADLAAQTRKKKEEEEEPAKTATQGKKPAKEEEEEPAKQPAQQGKKPAKEEEEEPGKTKPRTPLRVGDENLDDEARPRPKRPATQNINLEAEAKRALFPQVQELFRSLARPYDLATMPSGKTHMVAPVARYVGDHPDFSGTIRLQPIDQKGEPTEKEFPVRKDEVSSLDPYEHIALSRVDKFLKSLETAPETGTGALTKLEGYRQADKALQAVLNFHLSERLQERRTGPKWDELKQQLESKLRQLRLDQLHILSSTKDWDAAFELAREMAEQYRKDEAIQVEVARLLASHAQQAIEVKDFVGARRHLRLLEDMFPDSRESGPIRERLRANAEEIVRQADTLQAEKKNQAALAQLELAKSFYPDLPGLRDRILKISNQYPVLYVGVRTLPEFMSPATAVTDSEKQAVELMFESLIKLVDTPAGQRYELGLASQPPGLVPLGRQFYLNPKARWSSGNPVTATDVRETVRRLCDWGGRDREWADDLIKRGDGVRAADNSFRIRVILSRGCMDPLSFMDFKVLPQGFKRADDPNFAKAPVGSGPYMYSADQSNPREEIVFVSNPYYSEREGKGVWPHIREIHFCKWQDPIGDFSTNAQRPLGLLLDLTAEEYHKLRTPPPGVKLVAPMQNRRIYFLAVNHRRSMPKNPKVRRAIGLAINRDKVLDHVFRDGDPKLHRPLNGPYPPDTWAYDTALPRDPYKRDLAGAEAAEAKSGIGGARIQLSLKYCRDVPRAEKACNLIKQQVSEACGADGIDLVPTPRSAYDLHQDVEVAHDYDLAYYWWDFSDESYWLWPLFDPRATDGRNFLGYTGEEAVDPSLESLFRKVMSHRNFATVQDLTHQIHRQVFESMPLIPLWQLDTLMATGNGLAFQEPSEPPRKIDPLLIFTDVERWIKQQR